MEDTIVQPEGDKKEVIPPIKPPAKKRPKRGGKKTKKVPEAKIKGAKIFKVIFLNIGQGLSRLSDQIAEICVDDSAKGKAQKARKIKKVSIAMLKDAAAAVKKTVKSIDGEKIIRDVANTLGKFTKVTQDYGHDIFKSLKPKRRSSRKKKVSRKRQNISATTPTS